ncbi:MAG TPA: ABC transporter permease [Bryobacteraceae bacterium]|nr:ABC transporter permease [Bryobacteraceae bacterium]
MIDWLHTLSADARFGLRVLWRAPLVTFSIIVLLALGIGVNAAMFGIADAVLLHAVRYPDPRTLVFVWCHDAQGQPNDASPADFMAWRERSKKLTDIAAWMPTWFVVSGSDRPRQLGGARVTANFFRTLRVKPALGRTFLPDEDGLVNPENAAHSVVISYRYWQEDLAGDPNVLGRTIRVNSIPYTVIGVAPRDFQFWWRPHDLWIPVTLNVQEHDYRALVVVARLAAPRAQAAAEMTGIARALAKEFPKSNQGWTIQLDNLEDWFLGDTLRMRLLLLCGAVSLVLLIVCINVAGLLLARTAARSGEIAVRISLGASPRRIARQLLTESAMLALLGGALGLAIAWAMIQLAPKAVPADAIPGGPGEFSAAIVWFTLAVSILTCLLFGAAPAVSAARRDVQAALKDSSRGATAGRARLRFRQMLVAAEVAISLALLTGTWLMIGSLRELMRADPGFDAHHLLTLQVYLPLANYNTPRAIAFERQAADRVAALPGVRSVSAGSILPLFYSLSMQVRFEPEGSPPPGEMSPSASYFSVGQDYFLTFGIPLRRGRFFTRADDAKASQVVLVNESFAARFYPGQDPVGQRIQLNRPVRGGEETTAVQVAGVVGDIKWTDMSPGPLPTIYSPLAQNLFSGELWFAVRTAANPLELAPAVRKEFAALDPEEPVEQVGTLETMVNSQFAQPRFQSGVMMAFALMALLLASVGIYAVNAHAVAQRRGEIGLRIALGATRGDVLREVMGRGLRPTAAGIGIGLVASAAMMFWLKSVLVGAGNADPLAFVGAALLLALAALAACYLPARRATRIDPAVTLRAE